MKFTVAGREYRLMFEHFTGYGEYPAFAPKRYGSKPPEAKGVTVCLLIDGARVAGIGVGRCSSSDTFCRRTGCKEAVRCLADRLRAHAKRRAKKRGDTVLVYDLDPDQLLAEYARRWPDPPPPVVKSKQELRLERARLREDGLARGAAVRARRAAAAGKTGTAKP